MTLCGEIGGKPLEAMALLAIGYRGLSMSPAAIGPVKAALLADRSRGRARLPDADDRPTRQLDFGAA